MRPTDVVEADGARIPRLGFGTWRLRGRECRDSVRAALDAGYRHLDTAAMYGNEAEVGRGLADSGVDRDEVFVVTKLPPSSLDRGGVRRTVERSLSALDTTIDLLLIHWPSDRVPLAETLEAMREEQDAGRVRHLGVSNFDVGLLREAREHATIVCDQVELHPFRQQRDLVAFAEESGIAVTAYSPLAKGRVNRDDTLVAIADAHHATPAQVALRWLLDRPPVAVIPKAASEEHRRQNLEALAVELTDEDRERIGALG